MKKRVLLINPAKEDSFAVDRIHMGLSLLGEILTENGSDVRVVDFSYLRGLHGKIKIPSIAEIITEFKPDVIGVSVFSYLYAESTQIIDAICERTDSPIIIGGPHVTFFPQDFESDTRVSYVVRGEAESVIVDLVAGAKKQSRPVVINCPVPAPDAIPRINLDICLGSEVCSSYQIQLSRGCPFDCSFCNISQVAGHKVRARNLDLCLGEIVQAVAKYPSIRSIAITDDCPNFSKERFKEFLLKFADRVPGLYLTIDNVRADLLDEEMIQLYLKAGGRNICLGTESGHPEVFKLVNKGESIDKLIESARLIRKYNISLGLCFVIGLPEDNLERHMWSVRLAKKLKPDYAFWNMCVPWPGTRVHEWFVKHGEIGDVRNFSTLIDSGLNFQTPRAWSPAFTKEQRIRAWLMANLETYTLPVVWRLSPQFFSQIGKLFRVSWEYAVMGSLVRYLSGYGLHRGISIFKRHVLRRLN